jgi:L-histidine N-alpha-methyltransferase
MSRTLGPRATFDNRLTPSRASHDLELLGESLRETPRRIPSKFFYDARGSRLFENITDLPEYYLTRTEIKLLQRYADEISTLSQASQLVELGSGSSVKTRILLDAKTRAGSLRSYVPFDVSESELQRVALELTEEYADLSVHAIAADFIHDLAAIPAGTPRLTLLIGSTIGNFDRAEASSFLQRISASLEPGDWFLLGVDLVKEISRLEAAYNDAAGTTAEFNRNILRVVNRLADGNFDPDAFDHRAPFDRQNERIEMRLLATREQQVRLKKLDLAFTLAEGEEIVTEISSKYRRPGVEEMLTAAGLTLEKWYTDAAESFALALARKR